MAPNRKSTADVVDSLQVNASSFVLQSSKYAPLTAQPEPEPASDDAGLVNAPYSLDVTHPAQSYWDWPAQQQDATKEQTTTIARILEEERVRQLLSVSHVEKNLIPAQVVKTEEEDVEMVSAPETDDDYDYWYQPSEDYAPAPRTAAHAQPSYWDWPTLSEEEQRQQLIQQILEEDACRQTFSGAHIQENLMTKQQHAVPTTMGTPLTGAVGGHASYWDW
jgi:hypothetical protein